ncbi:MAG TPA: D-alanyl-D-alanine carboxypeptidase family protein [Thermoleophilaceae bacterium]|jgi:serine-type D-Ala-D-Ala carboxypeptidase (penicillin-binding protein 5/6)|nr:D-alanyl-D-alanine carboxypeptidase family protein [Thermoleophilaceae bacterium]
MGRFVSALLTVLAPLAVVAAAWVTFVREDTGGGSVAVPLAASAASGVDEEPAAPPAVSDAENAAPPDPPAATAGIDASLAAVDAFSLPFRKPPRAGMVFDLGSGEVLWKREPRRELPIASLTKIMTALVVVDRGRPAEPVRITKEALDYEGSAIGLLPKGRRVRLETLLNGLLIVSGNDAAIALAVHLGGSQAAFVRMMNRRARDWGLECTSFASPHGLSNGDRSCARDVAVLTRMAMRRKRISRIARREFAQFRFPTKDGRLYLTGHNPLMRLDYRGAIGLKTGYTDEAGRCFVGVARRGDRTLGVVLLNSFDPSRQAPKLLDAAFAAG